MYALVDLRVNCFGVNELLGIVDQGFLLGGLVQVKCGFPFMCFRLYSLLGFFLVV